MKCPLSNFSNPYWVSANSEDVTIDPPTVQSTQCSSSSYPYRTYKSTYVFIMKENLCGIQCRVLQGFDRVLVDSASQNLTAETVENQSDGSSGVGAVVGAAIGAFLFLIIIVAVIMLLRKKGLVCFKKDKAAQFRANSHDNNGGSQMPLGDPNEVYLNANLNSIAQQSRDSEGYEILVGNACKRPRNNLKQPGLSTPGGITYLGVAKRGGDLPQDESGGYEEIDAIHQYVNVGLENAAQQNTDSHDYDKPTRRSGKHLYIKPVAVIQARIPASDIQETDGYVTPDELVCQERAYRSHAPQSAADAQKNFPMTTYQNVKINRSSEGPMTIAGRAMPNSKNEETTSLDINPAFPATPDTNPAFTATPDTNTQETQKMLIQQIETLTSSQTAMMQKIDSLQSMVRKMKTPENPPQTIPDVGQNPADSSKIQVILPARTKQYINVELDKK